MEKRAIIYILLILLLGVIYRLLITSGGNFIFNIDNARDMVEVREMVELQKPRLTGPTSPYAGLNILRQVITNAEAMYTVE